MILLSSGLSFISICNSTFPIGEMVINARRDGCNIQCQFTRPASLLATKNVALPPCRFSPPSRSPNVVCVPATGPKNHSLFAINITSTITITIAIVNASRRFISALQAGFGCACLMSACLMPTCLLPPVA